MHPKWHISEEFGALQREITWKPIEELDARLKALQSRIDALPATDEDRAIDVILGEERSFKSCMTKHITELARVVAARRLDARGVERKRRGEPAVDHEVNEFIVRRDDVVFWAAYNRGLVLAIEDALNVYALRHSYRAYVHDLPPDPDYVAPQRFTDLNSDIQALIKVLVEKIALDECRPVHPCSTWDEETVHEFLKNAVMLLCKPPVGRPMRMSARDAYEALLRTGGWDDAEIAEALETHDGLEARKARPDEAREIEAAIE
jgi:hypothetical protein